MSASPTMKIEQKMKFFAPLSALCMVATVSLGACSPGPISEAPTVEFSAQNTGLIVGDCLLIQASALVNSTIHYVAFDHEPPTGSTLIAEKATPQDCPVFEANLAGSNTADKYTVYRLNSNLNGYAIASTFQLLLAEKDSKDTLSIQPTEQGQAKKVTVCTTNEAVYFEVWDLEPFQSYSLWAEYLPLGYDVERTCP